VQTTEKIGISKNIINLSREGGKRNKGKIPKIGISGKSGKSGE